MKIDFNALFLDFVRIFGPGFGLALGLLVLAVAAFLLRPNECKLAAAQIAGALRWLHARFGKRAVAWSVEGHINRYAERLSLQTPGVEPVGITVEFVEPGEIPASFWQDGQVVVRMLDAGQQDANLMRVAEAYVSHVLLPRSKAYMSSVQQRSLDLFVTGDLLSAESPAVYDTFASTVVSEAIGRTDRIGELLETFDVLNYAGLFYPILLQELAFLSAHRITKKKRSDYEHEVYELFDFFSGVARREVGNETTALEFVGRFSRCQILIVAKGFKVAMGDVNPWVARIKNAAGRFDTVYVIAPERHVPFMQQVIEAVGSSETFTVYGTRSYSAHVRRGHGWTTVEATVAVLRNPVEFATHLAELSAADEEYA